MLMLVMRLLALLCIFSLSYENGWAANIASSDWPQWAGN
jgi:peptidoglycan/LPS O-acetylase OafA/YrhL